MIASIHHELLSPKPISKAEVSELRYVFQVNKTSCIQSMKRRIFQFFSFLTKLARRGIIMKKTPKDFVFVLCGSFLKRVRSHPVTNDVSGEPYE